MTLPDTLRAGVIQFDIKTGDILANLKSAISAIRRLSGQGAHMAVLPELWTCGFDHAGLGRHAEKTPEILHLLGREAKRLGMAIAGSVPEKIEDRIYNTLVMVDADGSISGTYRKVHLFATGGEDKTFAAGTSASVWRTSLGPIGGIICYDLRFPELCRLLAVEGARMIMVCAQWPEPRITHWDILLRARAIENQVFILGANRTGKHGILAFPGHSQIISPSGEILAKTSGADSEALADIHFKDMYAFRNLFHCIKERVPEAYGVNPDRGD